MSDVATALYARLAGYSGLTDIVSTRIYPEAAPQGAQIPYVRYRILSTVDTDVFGGTLNPSRSLAQIGAVGKTYDEAQDVGAQVQNSLQRWSGTSDTIVVQGVFLDNEWDPGWDEDLEAYGKDQDFIIWHEE